VNLVDVLIVVLVGGALLHGLHLGAAIQVSSFLGLLAGLALGAALAPAVSRLGGDTGTQVVLTTVTVFGVGGLLGGVGRTVGVRLWRAAARLRLRALDAGLGAIIASGATLLAAWLVGGMIAAVPITGLSRAVQRSTILRALDGVLPSAPEVFARIDRLLDPLGVPKVFEGLEPVPPKPAALPPDPIVRAAAAKAQASVVRIVGPGCGGIEEGSGFIVGPGLVVTNAHVVAGTNRSVVQDQAGSHPATTVLFDPKLDVAVLATRGLAGPPLTLLPSIVPAGAQGAVLGYPGGGPLRVVPAAVLQEVNAVGRDIYGQSLTTRAVYEVRAVVRPGNSGGPLVDAAGSVVGVVFARSSYDGNLGFALTSTEVRSDVDAARGHAPMSNGPCAGA
jgi:S1-C subfamily serine protease